MLLLFFYQWLAGKELLNYLGQVIVVKFLGKKNTKNLIKVTIYGKGSVLSE